MYRVKRYPYVITYGNGKQTVRLASTAHVAVKRLCEQYGWSYSLRQYDAKTLGHTWAECMVDQNGGTNFSLRVVATKRN